MLSVPSRDNVVPSIVIVEPSISTELVLPVIIIPPAPFNVNEPDEVVILEEAPASNVIDVLALISTPPALAESSIAAAFVPLVFTIRTSSLSVVADDAILK